MSEYRQDDHTIGHCPRCGQVCSVVYVNGSGWCTNHGRIWCNWDPRPIRVRDIPPSRSSHAPPARHRN